MSRSDYMPSFSTTKSRENAVHIKNVLAVLVVKIISYSAIQRMFSVLRYNPCA